MDDKLDREVLAKEVHGNFAAFSKMKFDISDKGKFALLRDGKLIKIMDDRDAADKLGENLYIDGLYSIQEIMAEPIYAGFKGYAFG